jgi:large subunit ribosomal protein L23
MTSVILFPLITEKSSALQASSNQYCFVVHKDANKLEIAQAVKSLKKGIEVESVRTQIIRGKIKRMGASYGKRSNWKKAIVRLKDGQSLDLIEAV